MSNIFWPAHLKQTARRLKLSGRFVLWKLKITALLVAISVQLLSNIAISGDNSDLIETEIKGAELTRLKKFPTYDCYIYDNFVVFNIPSTEEASADSYIMRRSALKEQSEDCSFDQLKANQYIFASGWYLGLKGDYVFSDEGCCPGTRTLSIVRMSTRKQIYDTSYNSSYPVMIDERLNLRFYKEIEVKPTKQNCPQANERVKELELENQSVAVEDVLYSYGLDEEILLNLMNLKENPTGKVGCSYRQ